MSTTAWLGPPGAVLAQSASMEPALGFRCSTGVKAFVAVGLLAFVVCGSALAKFSISIAASDRTPAVGDRVTLIVRSEQPVDHNLRLIAVAPGQPVFRVVATITGDTSRPIQDVQRRGFEVSLRRAAPDR
jgi:hypothetical protein